MLPADTYTGDLTYPPGPVDYVTVYVKQFNTYSKILFCDVIYVQ